MDAQTMSDLMRNPYYADLLMKPMAPMLSRSLNDMALYGTTTTVATPPPNIADIDKVYEQIKRATLEVEAPTWNEPPPRVESKRHVYCNGYSALAYTYERFTACVDAVSRRLPGLMREYDADAVVVRGTSGVTFGTACWMHSKGALDLVIARKSGEGSHGMQIEWMGSHVNRTVSRYIVLDDFVSSGNTVKGIREDMGGSECVAILEYRHAERTGRMTLERDFDGIPIYLFDC